MSINSNSDLTMICSKNPNRRGDEDIIFWTNLLNFVTLTLEILWKNRLSPMQLPENCFTLLGNSKAINYTWIFLKHTSKFYFFFNLPVDFSHDLSSIPLDLLLVDLLYWQKSPSWKTKDSLVECNFKQYQQPQ